MQCPKCNSEYYKRKGSFTRKTDGVEVKRFQCKACGKSFSEQTFRFDYWKHRKQQNEFIIRSLTAGVSQRRSAWLTVTSKKKIDGFISPLGKLCKQLLHDSLSNEGPVENVMFDEMESFEHTKLKPVTIGIAVEKNTRRILSIHTGSIVAKGLNAHISVAKYGKRKCERKNVLELLMEDLKPVCTKGAEFITDQSKHYINLIKSNFPDSKHITVKGRKGCVTGQGELKKGGRDPLFSLNHTYAMIRDNLKRLTRRTWCTSKMISKMEDLIYIYAWIHNCSLKNMKRYLP